MALNRRTLLLLAALGVATSCVSPSERRWAEVRRTTWSLVSIEGEPPIPGGVVELHLEGGRRLFGNGGVNEFFGSYLHDGEAFTSTKIATTRRVGPPDLLAQERRIVSLIEAADRVEASSNRLRLLAGERLLLEFVPAKGTKIR
ncbi:MAG TPA: META domain-containing protein [Planctomycetes bacterium]|nr:META domain-containing protein [Planctomycetota bacterium]